MTRNDDERLGREREGREFTALAELLTEGIAICRAGRIVWANRRLAQIAGRNHPGILVGTEFRGLFECERSAPPLSEVTRPQCCRILRPEDEPREVRVQANPCSSEEDSVTWVVFDESRDRDLEQEIVRANRELHDLHRELAGLRERLRRDAEEREELLTMVSHELRTPVTVISGYNRLLLSGKVGSLSEDQTRFLEESTRSCRRLSAFIGNLLEGSRDYACHGAVEVCETSIEASLDGVVSFLKPLLDERQLSVGLEIAPEASVARFDPVRIDQVLTNLIGNAIKYAPVGGRVEIATRSIDEGGHPRIEVAISDNGPGVAPADRERIFLPYFRGEETNDAQGLGLGLAICKRLVDAHGGRISVGERPGGGSRFSFTLPAPSNHSSRTRRS